MSDSTPDARSTAPSPAALAHVVPGPRTLSAPVQGPPAVPAPADVRPVAADGDGTGDDAVDEALGRLRDVADLDLRAQLVTFEAVHGALQDRLADAEG